MSKLSRIRILNLNYNNNTIKLMMKPLTWAVRIPLSLSETAVGKVCWRR